MKIFVTGGTGFIGRNLVERLIRESMTVHLLLRPGGVVPSDLINSVSVQNVCLSDSEGLRMLFENEKYEVVVHLANTTIPKTSNNDPHYDVQSNLIGALNLLNASALSGVAQFIFASSGGTVYGAASQDIVTEESPTNPICSYGVVKLAIEKYIQFYSHEYGLNYSILRFANPYGKYQYANRGQGVISTFSHAILNSEPMYIWGDGENVRDYIFVDDVVDAVISSFDCCDSGVYNISSGVGVTVNTVIREIERATKRTAIVNYLPARTCDLPYVVLSPAKAITELGWQRRIPFEKGIDNVIRWCRDDAHIMN